MEFGITTAWHRAKLAKFGLATAEQSLKSAVESFILLRGF